MAFKFLGNASPVANTNVSLYQVPDGKSVVGTLNVCNTGSVTAKIKVAIATSTTPTTKEYIEFGTELSSQGVLERTGLIIGSNEYVIISCDVAGVAFRLSGSEE